MTSSDHIRNPAEWGVDQVKAAGRALEHAGHSLAGADDSAPLPEIRRIELADLKDVLLKGLSDFGVYRSDVVFICIVYPLAGLVLAWLALNNDILPLLFPLASGFALSGRSRRWASTRSAGGASRASTPPGPTRSASPAPAFGAILCWASCCWRSSCSGWCTAYTIYQATLGQMPLSPSAAFYPTCSRPAPAGRYRFRCRRGFLFAVLVLTISVVSFPMLLDRDPGLFTAVATSVTP